VAAVIAKAGSLRSASRVPAVLGRGALVVLAVLGALAAAYAQERPAGEPGRFDFYVLALSWAPSFCAATAERDWQRRRPPSMECSRPFGFVVHGLWPQYEHGYPESCQVPAPRLDHRIVAAMLDLMPSRRLVYREWDRHGTCSGLSQRAYFDTVRRARVAVKIPQQLADPHEPLKVDPAAIAGAFRAANPGLPGDGIEVVCRGRQLIGVRICLAKDLRFRHCPDVASHGCARASIVVPPLLRR
jgi:ribonuclease T2